MVGGAAHVTVTWLDISLDEPPVGSSKSTATYVRVEGAADESPTVHVNTLAHDATTAPVPTFRMSMRHVPAREKLAWAFNETVAPAASDAALAASVTVGGDDDGVGESHVTLAVLLVATVHSFPKSGDVQAGPDSVRRARKSNVAGTY
jgi:hypothetical protein